MVVSPEMSRIDVILDDGTGPRECFCDVVYIEAENKDDARLLGFKIMEQENMDWPEEARSDNINPYAGLTVEEVCPCTVKSEPCPSCEEG